MQRLHRYSVEGLSTLTQPGAKLIVAYHGRPMAFDAAMLTVTLYDQLGYLPHGVVHKAARLTPFTSRFVDELGFVTGRSPELERAVERGEHIIVTPGGLREGFRSRTHRYRVDQGHHRGYLKLARQHNLPIVPVAARGVDDLYIGLSDAIEVPLLPIPLWVGLGPMGLFPFSPPFPVKIHQLIGAPILPGEHKDLGALHQHVQERLQALLNQARTKA